MNTLQAADKLNISVVHVNYLLRAGKLKGTKIWKVGQLREVWEIEDTSVYCYLNNRPKVGRPRKSI